MNLFFFPGKVNKVMTWALQYSVVCKENEESSARPARQALLYFAKDSTVFHMDLPVLQVDASQFQKKGA